MTSADLIAQRLSNQRLATTTFKKAEEVVAWLGAVQSQDYSGAKWALGLRAAGLTDAAVDLACDEGRILRTHVLRPTWHFVVPADIRWMLALTAPRVHGFSGSYYRKHELEAKVFGRCHKAIAKALAGGKHLTRAELQTALRKAGIESDNLRLGLIVMHAELSALICSGPRRGKQFTYALLDERVPSTPTRSRDASLAELAKRYLTSHGPATVRDYSWWSGLSMRDAKVAFELIAAELEQRVLDGVTHWSLASQPAPRDPRKPRKRAGPVAWLLPNFDEYFIAYKDREIVLRQGLPTPSAATGRGRVDPRPEFAHLLTIDGCLAGTWKRTFTPRTAGVELRTLRPLTKPERDSVDEAVARYEEFLKLPVTLTLTT
jgi:hypothetical protein